MKKYFIFLIFLLGCKNRQENAFSKNFKYQNLKNFKIFEYWYKEDSSEKFYNTLKALPKSELYPNNYYYSWQKRTKSFDDYTIIENDGEHGVVIEYFIKNKNDSIISKEVVASIGGEGGYIFETRSKFLNDSTLERIRSISTGLDFNKLNFDGFPTHLGHYVGDTTFECLHILSNGKISVDTIRKKENLHYELNNHLH